ncbi:MAG TPA: GNAT family N-acetyltransferase [Rhodanobacter sp.]|nr:GNAT family N-acetyltransferase [Rhodanobacter sp.]
MDIVTARLRLDALLPADAPALFAYRSDPAVSRWQGWQPATVVDAEHFIEVQQGAAPDMPGAWWQRAIRLRATRELIGDAGVHNVDAETVELGITLAPAQQRHGYARETLEVILDYVFGGLQKQHAIALVAPGNLRCMRLLEGVGMRRIAAPGDDVMYTLPRAAWLAPPANWDDRG